MAKIANDKVVDSVGMKGIDVPSFPCVCTGRYEY